MRDIALTLIVFGLLPFVFTRPYIGAMMWAWISLMIPHRLTFGFAHTFPFAYIVAITTLIAFFTTKQRNPFPRGPIPALLVSFVLWMTVTSVFAIAPGEVIFPTWLQVMKIHLMLLVTLMLLKGRQHIDMLVWVIVVSIGFYGLKGGIWILVTGGGERVYGPPGGAIEENNALATALVMTVPLMYYLRSVATDKWVRMGLVIAMIFCSFSILGSQSRGAFLAIIAAAAMLVLKSNRPVILGIVGSTLLAGAIAFMPDKWTDRMKTMESEETLDYSANSRLYTWETLWKMALDRPITGAGFETTLPEIFQRYSPVPDMLAYSPHSIYFQVLGEHGFVGLFLFLALVFATWRRATSLARTCRSTPGLEWGDVLMRMIQVSLIGFLVGGAFLNLLHFHLPYYLMGLVVLLDVVVREQRASTAPKAALRRRPPVLAREGRLVR